MRSHVLLVSGFVLCIAVAAGLSQAAAESALATGGSATAISKGASSLSNSVQNSLNRVSQRIPRTVHPAAAPVTPNPDSYLPPLNPRNAAPAAPARRNSAPVAASGVQKPLTIQGENTRISSLAHADSSDKGARIIVLH